ncbi:MAG: tRNA (guanosine(46)-N7)-methyltransferase TrmB [Pyrinomonadaceae bacterium]|nr:tRNA (guanosine(46)-N7)-methyltransferase TrmB [Pyrinomonadaceae bacterium]
MARPRIHQHVNPLARYFRQLPIEPLKLSNVFENPQAPIHIDLGCGRGRFLQMMATERPGWNFLGIEIREPLVIAANETAEEEGLRNLYYSFCNAPLDLGKLLVETPSEKVSLVTIQFPDPWFKKRHAKRRMVNEQLVRFVKENLATDGLVFIQTDVEELDQEMEEYFVDGGFSVKKLNENPMPVKTEREISVENRSLPVYRKEYRVVG